MGRVRDGVPLPSRLGVGNVTSSPGLLVNHFYRTCAVVGYETVTRVLILLIFIVFLQLTTAESRGGQELNGSPTPKLGDRSHGSGAYVDHVHIFGVTVIGTT